MKEKWEVVENYFSSYVCDVCVEWVGGMYFYYFKNLFFLFFLFFQWCYILSLLY